MLLALEAGLVLAAVLLTAYYAGIETGIISLRRVRLEHRRRAGDPRAETAAYYLDNPDRLFGTTLVGTNLCTVIASVAAAGVLAHVFGPWGAGASGILMTAVILVFGEYLPKAWFRARPTERSLALIPMLKFSERLLYPVGRLLTWLVRVVMPLAAHGGSFAKPFVSRDELQLLALESEEAGRISRREREIITAILALPGRHAAEAMTPAREMVCIEAAEKGSAAVELARRSGHTRLVVVEGGRKRVVGVVNVLDVLRLEGEKAPVSEFLAPAYFVPAEAGLTEVLKRMRMLREPLLLVGDERHCRGLITTDDILRLVVGTS